MSCAGILTGNVEPISQGQPFLFSSEIASIIGNRHRLSLRARESDGCRGAKEPKTLNRAGIEGNCGPNLRGGPAHEDFTLRATLMAARWKL